MTYLVGDLQYLRDDQDCAEMYCEFKSKITSSDLAKCKQDSTYQIVNLSDKTYFDPTNNTWVKIKSDD